MAIKWKTTDENVKLIAKIAARAMALAQKAYENAREYPGVKPPAYNLQDVQMDIAATHLNGCPLRLADLLAADDFNFSHDVFGIRRHLDRETGKLTGHFLPRFSAPSPSRVKKVQTVAEIRKAKGRP